MFFTTLMIICGVFYGVESQNPLFASCDSTTRSPYSGPPLPTLPDQYETMIEANIIQKNYTTHVREYYDYPNNRLTTEWYSRRDGSKVRVVNRPEQEEMRMVYENGSCQVRHINVTSSLFYSFVSGPNGTHVKSVRDLMVFGKEYGETYEGEDVVRGIPVEHWQTCLKYVQGEGQFTLDFYFSKDMNYRVDSQQVRIPVRAVLQGQGESLRNKSAGLHSFHHIYDFTDFHAGPIKDKSVFEIPPGVYCNGSSIMKTMPTVSDQFSAGVEEVTEFVDSQSQMPVNIYLDRKSNILRLDLTRPLSAEDAQKYGDRPLTYISDRHANLVYVLDRWEENCTVFQITGPDEDVPIFTSAEQFFNIFNMDYAYQGKKMFRGLSVESWASYNESRHMVTELFFRQNDNSQMNGPRQPVPSNATYTLVGVIMNSIQNQYQFRTKSVIHFYGYMPTHPKPEAFDVSPCYSLGHHYVYMAFKVKANYDRNVEYRKREFVLALQSAIARGAGVSLTRVTAILAEQNPYNSTQIVVYFKLLDNQLYGMSRHRVGISLSEAKLNLQNAIAAGLNFDVQYPTIEMNFEVVKDTLWETMSYTGSTSYNPPSVLKYSSGAMAGLGIGMLVVGAILGLLVAYAIYKKVDSSVPYQVTN